MRHSKEFQSVDGVAAKDDLFQVEVQPRPTGEMLYVHVNGQTVLRISHIDPDHIQFIYGGETFDPHPPARPNYVGLDDLRERFKSHVSNLPNYKRTDVWSYIAALEAVIQHKDKEISKLADSYTKGYEGGLFDAKLKPGDGMMGG